MHTAAPRVTVLMSVHNGGTYVDEAVRSILSQTFTDFEFLVIDDGSADGTAARIEALGDPRVRLIRNEANIGLTRSLNRGLALARGALIARQDADDVSYPQRLAMQVDFLDRHPAVAVLGTQARTIDARGRAVNVAPWPKSTSEVAIRWQLLFDSPFVHTSVMFRTDVIRDELGGYNEEFTTSQDFALWSRVAAAGYSMRNLPRTLVDFRTHQESVSGRYELANVAKLSAVLLNNLISQLGAVVPDGWPDIWIRLNNPRVFPDSSEDDAAVVRAITAIHARFVQLGPEAAENREIRRHLAAMLIRAANAGARRGRVASISSFARAARVDPGMAAPAIPRYVGQMVLGRARPKEWWRHRRQATARRTPPRAVIELARAIYKATPVAALRQIYFAAFCRLVRQRRVRAAIDGLTFELDLGEMIDVAVYLERYELDVAAALRRYCRPGMTVLDIGANIGAHALTMGKLVTATGAVYAFEPMDFAFQKLTRNLSLNDLPHVRAIKSALNARNVERQVVHYRSSWCTAGGRQDPQAVVDFVRLDDWCAQNGVSEAGVIKIDIDGNEFEALAGGVDLLERARPVIIIEAVWQHFVDDGRNPFALLKRLGYRFRNAKSHRAYREAADIARLFPEGDRAMTRSVNVIATPLSMEI